MSCNQCLSASLRVTASVPVIGSATRSRPDRLSVSTRARLAVAHLAGVSRQLLPGSLLSIFHRAFLGAAARSLLNCVVQPTAAVIRRDDLILCSLPAGDSIV
jgi:hypothetical protein